MAVDFKGLRKILIPSNKDLVQAFKYVIIGVVLDRVIDGPLLAFVQKLDTPMTVLFTFLFYLAILIGGIIGNIIGSLIAYMFPAKPRTPESAADDEDNNPKEETST